MSPTSPFWGGPISYDCGIWPSRDTRQSHHDLLLPWMWAMSEGAGEGSMASSMISFAEISFRRCTDCWLVVLGGFMLLNPSWDYEPQFIHYVVGLKTMAMESWPTTAPHPWFPGCRRLCLAPVAEDGHPWDQGLHGFSLWRAATGTLQQWTVELWKPYGSRFPRFHGSAVEPWAGTVAHGSTVSSSRHQSK